MEEERQSKPTLLVIGDEIDWDSFKKFRKRLLASPREIFYYVFATYDQLANNQLPIIDSQVIIVMLFFPFNFWGQKIEHSGYHGIYGNREFYTTFYEFWTCINQIINAFYGEKTLHFINPPLSVPICRDKELTKSILVQHNIPVSPSIFTRDLEEILQMIQRGETLYIKVRFGSMGKGITVLRPEKWETNFRFEDNRIASTLADHGWTFVEITGNMDFLRELLTKDVVIEKNIEPCVIDGLKFDLRIYVFMEEALYVYARANHREAVTTNISQGAHGMPPNFLKNIPEATLTEAKSLAVKSAQAVGLELVGADIMINDRLHPVVIELNSFPGFPPTQNLDPAINFPLSEKIIARIEAKIKIGAFAPRT